MDFIAIISVVMKTFFIGFIPCNINHKHIFLLLLTTFVMSIYGGNASLGTFEGTLSLLITV